MKMEINDMINCLIELKQRVANLGKTNIITHREMDEILVRNKINLKELERLKK